MDVTLLAKVPWTVVAKAVESLVSVWRPARIVDLKMGQAYSRDEVQSVQASWLVFNRSATRPLEVAWLKSDQGRLPMQSSADWSLDVDHRLPPAIIAAGQSRWVSVRVQADGLNKLRKLRSLSIVLTDGRLIRLPSRDLKDLIEYSKRPDVTSGA